MAQPTRAVLPAAPAAPPGRGPATRAWWRPLGPPLAVVSDAALLALAWWLAHFARYALEVGGAVPLALRQPFAVFRPSALLFGGVALLLLSSRGGYRPARAAGMLDETALVAGAVTTAMAGVILSAFLLRFAPSRLVVLYGWVGALVLLGGRRGVTRWGRGWLWRRGHLVDRVLVVGASQTGRRLMQAMMSQPALGYRVVGYVDDTPRPATVAVATEWRIIRTPRLGAPDEIGTIVAAWGIDEVMIALPAAEYGRVVAVVAQCRARGVRFRVVPDVLQLSLDRIDWGEIAGIPLLGVREGSLRGLNAALKRGIDLGVASAGLLLLALPMLLIAWLIRRDSPGPVLVRQRRLGRGGRVIEVWKFRSMIDRAEERWTVLVERGVGDPRLFKVADDPRLTRLGRVLRRWSLDELPQLVQVVRGELSLVGPRPPLPAEVARYEAWHRQRLQVTPGLTGLWQVNGRSTLGFDEMVRLDLYYAEHWSPWLDLKIIVRTVRAILSGTGAY